MKIETSNAVIGLVALTLSLACGPQVFKPIGTDGGTQVDGGLPDGGAPADAGPPPDAGTLLPNGATCASDAECEAGTCLPAFKRCGMACTVQTPDVCGPGLGCYVPGDIAGI